MPARITAHQASAGMAEAAAKRAPERAHQRYQTTRNAEAQANRPQHVKEVRDSYEFSPEAKARAAARLNYQPASANTGADTSITPQFSERPGVSFGGKG